jgi:hypothetical protein
MAAFPPSYSACRSFTYSSTNQCPPQNAFPVALEICEGSMPTESWFINQEFRTNSRGLHLRQVVWRRRQALESLTARPRRHEPSRRRLFLLTHSWAILDLTVVGHDEAVIYCFAKHSPAIQTLVIPGVPNCRSVSTCLALPEMHERTEYGIV